MLKKWKFFQKNRKRRRRWKSASSFMILFDQGLESQLLDWYAPAFSIVAVSRSTNLHFLPESVCLQWQPFTTVHCCASEGVVISQCWFRFESPEKHLKIDPDEARSWFNPPFWHGVLTVVQEPWQTAVPVVHTLRASEWLHSAPRMFSWSISEIDENQNIRLWVMTGIANDAVVAKAAKTRKFFIKISKSLKDKIKKHFYWLLVHWIKRNKRPFLKKNTEIDSEPRSDQNTMREKFACNNPPWSLAMITIDLPV